MKYLVKGGYPIGGIGYILADKLLGSYEDKIRDEDTTEREEKKK